MIKITHVSSIKSIETDVSSSTNGVPHSHRGSVNSSYGDNSGLWRMNSKEFRREMIKYRLKYLFAQPCSLFCKTSIQRIPSGKKVYLFLVLLGLEQLAYSVSSDIILNKLFLSRIGIKNIPILRSIIVYIAGNLPFPIVGWIADACVGQYWMMHFSMWILWLGYAAMAFLCSISKFASWNSYLFPFCFLAASFGSAGFQANAIPLGADVINYKTSEELSSYFHYYYWMRNLAITVYLVCTACADFQTKRNTVIDMIPVLCISLSLVLNGCFRNWFDRNRERKNPYWKVIRVLFLAMVIKRPIHRSAFSFSGASPPSRINLAKKVHGGKFSNEEVEDVKTFLRLLLVALSVLSSLVLFMGLFQVTNLQLHDMHPVLFGLNSTNDLLNNCIFSDKFTFTFNSVTILFIIPLLVHIIYPFLREYVPNMLKRIGLGFFLASVSVLMSLFLSAEGTKRDHSSSCMFTANFSSWEERNSYSNNPAPDYLIMIPHFFYTMAEIFINVTSLEFFYAQSPHKMRGMMIGLFFFVWGVGSALAETLILVFSKTSIGPSLTCDFWYYFMYVVYAVLAFVVYVVLACWYKNRQRGETDSVQFYRHIS